jgi:hypothetical protein
MARLTTCAASSAKHHIDDVGRATAVIYASLAHMPQAPELKYFLVKFVTAHYSRMRATVR